MTYKSRYREEGGFVAAQNAVNYQTYPVSDTNRTWSPSQYAAGYPNGSFKSMSDVVDSEYFDKKKRGEVMFHPMSLYKRTASVTGGGLAYATTIPAGTAPQYIWQGRLAGDEFGALVAGVLGVSYVPPEIVTGADVNRLVDEVCTDVWASVGTTRTQLLEDVAEWQQTLNMFRSPASGLFRWAGRFDSSYYRLVAQRKKLVKDRKGRNYARQDGAWADFAQGVMSLYLETRYGLKPLVSSIVGTLDVLNDVSENLNNLWTTRKKGELHGDNRSAPLRIVKRIGQSDVTLTVVTTHDVVVRGMSMDIVRMTLNRKLGFNITQIPATMWNLTTLSFAVDWFANVGSYIAAMTPSLDVRNRGSCVSVRDTRQSIITVESCVGVPPCIVTTPLRGNGCISTYNYERGPLRPPVLTVKSDWGFSKPTRILDALALAGQRISLLRRLIDDVPPSYWSRVSPPGA